MSLGRGVLECAWDNAPLDDEAGVVDGTAAIQLDKIRGSSDGGGGSGVPVPSYQAWRVLDGGVKWEVLGK